MADHEQKPISTEKPAKTIEVELVKKYCPRYLPAPDGTFVWQDSKGVTATLSPGIMRLHHEDAQIALNANGVAKPTNNTFRDLDH